jgi:signal transduction histidine kinase
MCSEKRPSLSMMQQENAKSGPAGAAFDPGDSLVQALLRSSRDSVKLIDLDGNVVLANAAGAEAADATGAGGALGRPWRSLWPKEAHRQIDRLLADAKLGQMSTATIYRPAAKGAPDWRHVTACPVFDSDGAVTHIVSQSHRLGGNLPPPDELARQMADQQAAIILLAKQLESESRRLSESRKQVSQSEKVKLLGQFVGGVVHDINNVLAVMTSASHLLRRESPSSAAAHILDHADAAIERGARLVRQLLDFSRVNSENPEVVYLERLLSQDAHLLVHLAGPEIKIRLDFSDDAWPVLVAPGKLQTVIFNLVANSRDAMPNGGDLRLQLTNCYENERPLGLPPKDYIALTVSDTGKGMAPEVLARAGEPFYTTKEKGRGTGLGLASAFDLAEQCGGGVALRSELGKGTAVTIHLPRAAVAGQLLREPAAFADSEEHGGATILIVEDDDTVRRHLGNLLRSLTYAVIEATSPQHALAATLSAVKIDLIVASLGLASAPGFDLLRRKTRPAAAIPRIFLSASVDEPVPQGEMVFRKPIAEALFLQAVLQELGRAPASIVTAETLRLADKVRDRIRNPKVRNLYESWRRLASDNGRLPTPDDAAHFDNALSDNSYLLEIMGPEDAPAFRFARVGNALTERLGRPLEGEILRASDHDVLGSITRAFQRCLKGVAYFDYSRLSLGDGRMLLFERLLLPLSDNKTTVTHLFGVATFDELENSNS